MTHALISISDGKVNKATTISVAALMLSLTVYMGTYTQYRRVHTHQTFTHGLAVWGPESVPLAFPVYASPPGPAQTHQFSLRSVVTKIPDRGTPSTNVIAWHIKPESKNRAWNSFSCSFTGSPAIESPLAGELASNREISICLRGSVYHGDDMGGGRGLNDDVDKTTFAIYITLP